MGVMLQQECKTRWSSTEIIFFGEQDRGDQQRVGDDPPGASPRVHRLARLFERVGKPPPRAKSGVDSLPNLRIHAKKLEKKRKNPKKK